MPKASLSINQASCWARFLFHSLSLFFLSALPALFSHETLVATPLQCLSRCPLSDLTFQLFSCGIKPIQGKRTRKKKKTQANSPSPSLLLLLMFEPRSWVFFISIIKACIMEAEVIRLLSSGCGSGPTEARLSPAVLLIHRRVLRRDSAALTGHQQLTNYSGFVSYLSKTDYVSQYVCASVREKRMLCKIKWWDYFFLSRTCNLI